MTSHCERTMPLSRIQKARYRNMGKDMCQWCRKELNAFEVVVVKFNGNSCRLYHEECYKHKVIEV